MPDKDLRVSDFCGILRRLGCSVEIVKGVLKARKGESRGWQQHLHKGEQDILRRDRVNAARRRLGLLPRDGVPDEDFYSKM